MRRKRLNHAAENLCSIFCGWRLTNSFAEIQALGSGTLDIDALSAHCSFNGGSVEPLSIAFELQAWLARDLEAHNIPPSALKEAVLQVSIELNRVPAPSGPKSGFYIGKNGLPIEKGEFFKLAARCRSSIRTDDAHYHSEKLYREQWPVGWPQT